MSNPWVVGIVIGLALAWAYHQFAVPAGAPAWPVVISYDKIGQAMDRLGVPFNQANVGR
jgi:hypothetical protein